MFLWGRLDCESDSKNGGEVKREMLTFLPLPQAPKQRALYSGPASAPHPGFPHRHCGAAPANRTRHCPVHRLVWACEGSREPGVFINCATIQARLH